MTKAELINVVAEKADIQKKEADRIIGHVLDAITESLVKGDKVSLVGFGTFETKERAARQGVNPHTGDAIDIPACVVPAFKAGKALKDSVAGK